MYYNLVHTNIDSVLPRLMGSVLSAGEEVGSRNGRVKEFMHVGVTLTNPTQREITLPSRKANLAAQIAETMWVLAGRNDIEWLSHYLPRAKDFSDDGRVWRAGYGPRLRNWVAEDGYTGRGVDQLAHVVDLLRKDPLDRRAVISLWDPQIDTQPGKDIACNNWLSFSSRLGKLDLHVAIRSNDLMWGWSGINAFEWSALQEIVAGLLGVQVGSLHFSITSLHLYEQHWAKAAKIAEDRAPVVASASPAFEWKGGTLEQLDNLIGNWFHIEAMIREGTLGEDQHLVDLVPEPMLRSWLRVLQWWWTGDKKFMGPLEGTRLWHGMEASVQSVRQQTVSELIDADLVRMHSQVFGSPFLRYVTKLHNEKHAAYGDSWKRRGEMLGIMANIARKIDRLGQNGAGETAADTAIDLLVYLAKYKIWLWDQYQGTTWSDDPEVANREIANIEQEQEKTRPWEESPRLTETVLADNFAALERAVTEAPQNRASVVSLMLGQAYRLARTLWKQENQYRGADVD